MELLFVCTGNTCRSAMAEGIANAFAAALRLDVHAASAGVWASEGCLATFAAVSVLMGRGIDISNHMARPLRTDAIEDADMVLCMEPSHCERVLRLCPSAAEKTDTLMHCALGSNDTIPDPYGGDLDQYEQTADRLELAIALVLSKAYPEKVNEIRAAYEQARATKGF